MRLDITHELAGRERTLAGSRHVAIDAGHGALGRPQCVVEDRLPSAGVAVLAFDLHRVDADLIFVPDTEMRVVTGDALNHLVDGGLHLVELLMVLDEPAAGGNLIVHPAPVMGAEGQLLMDKFSS